MVRKGNRRDLGEKLNRTREEIHLRDASPSFYLSNLKLESKAIYQKKKFVFFSAQTTLDEYEGPEMNSSQGPLYKFPFLPIYFFC